MHTLRAICLIKEDSSCVSFGLAAPSVEFSFSDILPHIEHSQFFDFLAKSCLSSGV